MMSYCILLVNRLKLSIGRDLNSAIDKLLGILQGRLLPRLSEPVLIKVYTLLSLLKAF